MARKSARRPLIVGAALVSAFVILRIVLPKVLPEQMGQGAAFFTVLFAILSAYISGITILSRVLSGRISQRVFGLIEKAFIAGILLGVAGMFQPWVHAFYRIGFLVLFASTWSFTVWGYVVPKTAHSGE
ncbi:MAG: hypothetical protein PVF54_07230 [Anaerolineae bacterium]|jgi:hypothetical protein